jgi:hypothetical protein
MLDSRLKQPLLLTPNGDSDKSSPTHFGASMMQQLFEKAPETDDNLNCRQHIEYGYVEGRDYAKGGIYGLKVKGSNLLVSDIMNVVEDLEIPPEVHAEYASLTLMEWEAVTRLMTMILVSLESPVIPSS